MLVSLLDIRFADPLHFANNSLAEDEENAAPRMTAAPILGAVMAIAYFAL